jgi:hypothetical protein
MKPSEKEEKDPVVKATMEIEVAVPRDNWIDYLTQFSDILGHDYIGYWARGAFRNKRGWLLWEFEMDQRPLPAGVHYVDHLSAQSENKLHATAIRAFKDGEALPPHYHALDEAAAIKAYLCGVEWKGVDWFDDGDCDAYDYVLQQALLGEQRYA